ncbi:dihydrofolate reductase [Nocardioides sp.]|uniref:dihydrofolate reductase n=1 Tax=Nocardioides sp. TaxID=35761 RepID=UPI003D0F5F0E
MSPGGPQRRIVLVAAVADNGVIGRDGGLPWHLSEDLQHFRRITTGNTVVMGRTTFDSIGRPLPHRTNIVVTRNPEWTHEGVLVAGSVEEALTLAQGYDADVMVMGGAQIYDAMMPLATHQVLTEVHQSPPGDTTYPAWDRADWVEERRESHDGFDFVWWARAG